MATPAYFAQNPDVAASYSQNNYGLSPEAYAQAHFESYGRNEQRISPQVAEVAAAGAAGSGTTIAPTYTPVAAAYFQQNPDVAKAYQANTYGLTPDQFASTHYQLYGQTEKRAAPTSISNVINTIGSNAATTTTTALPKYFLDNPDVAASYLVNSYGLTPEQFAAKHFQLYGQREQRVAPPVTPITGTPVTPPTAPVGQFKELFPSFAESKRLAGQMVANRPSTQSIVSMIQGQTGTPATPIGTTPITTPVTTSALPTYFTRNPDVAASYLTNNYGLTPEQFALTHFQKFGQSEQRAAPTGTTATPSLSNVLSMISK